MAAGGCRADWKPETASKCRGGSQLPSPQPLSEQQPAGLLTFLQRSRGAQSHAKRIPFPSPHTLQTPLRSVVINNSNSTTDDNRNEQSPFRATLSSFSLFSSLRRYLTTAVVCSWTHRRLRRCLHTHNSVFQRTWTFGEWKGFFCRGHTIPGQFRISEVAFVGTSLDGDNTDVGWENVAQIDTSASRGRRTEAGSASAAQTTQLLNRVSWTRAEGKVLLGAPRLAQRCPW